jgi:hypothetical protein
MSVVVHARVTEQLARLRLRYVAERLDAVLSEAARTEPTYLDFLDSVLRQEVEAKQRTRVTMGLKIAHFPSVKMLDLDTPEPEMSFDDLFGGTGWKPAITASPTREDAIITLYGDRMKATGAFDFVTSTRIKKPLSERSYFHLVYGTRHLEGLLEFRRVEERENLEQERVRMDAQQLDRVKRTGQAELFGTDDFPDVGPTSFEAERRENLGRAEERLVRILQSGTEFRYESARAAMMEVPLVWETDVQRIVKDKADVIGITKRERVPKPGHRLKLKIVR